MQKWKQASVNAINTARLMFVPPPKQSVSEWADQNRILSVSESPLGGLWDTDNTPYLREIMNRYTDNNTRMIAFLKSSQVGATEVGINICAYTVDHDPSRLLYVMPDDDLAKDFSTDRLQKALRMTPSIDKKLEACKSLRLRFAGGFIALQGAQSPAKLASWAIPRVVMDEVDKYPRWTGNEASPIKLVMERTKNFPWRKIMIMSTPTTEAGNIYQAYQNADVKYKYFMPCPECGYMQTFDFPNLIFPGKDKNGKRNSRNVLTNTYYQCPACHCHIEDRHKKKMLKLGKWQVVEGNEDGAVSVGYHINALYSPFVTFGDVAKEYVDSKDTPEQLMNFVNSWLGEPWRSKASKIETSSVMKQRTNVPAGFVPKWAKLLTGGVDVQQGYFYWVIRAWGAGMTSQKIACGQCVTFGDLQQIMDTSFPREDKPWQKEQVMLYCVDSGYDTESVYDYCYSNLNIAIPVKGSSRPMPIKYKITSTEPKDKRIMPLNLYTVDTDQYKNWLVHHLDISEGMAGAWLVDADTTEEYAEMICSEHKIVTQEGRYAVERWEKISSSRANHYLDCEVYAAVAADIMNVRYLQDTEEEETQNVTTQEKGITFDRKFSPY